MKIKKWVYTQLFKRKDFETILNKKETHLYWSENTGIRGAFTNYGGRIIGLSVKDKNGKLTDLTIGMNSVSGFQKITCSIFWCHNWKCKKLNSKRKIVFTRKIIFCPVKQSLKCFTWWNQKISRCGLKCCKNELFYFSLLNIFRPIWNEVFLEI